MVLGTTLRRRGEEHFLTLAMLVFVKGLFFQDALWVFAHTSPIGLQRGSLFDDVLRAVLASMGGHRHMAVFLKLHGTYAPGCLEMRYLSIFGYWQVFSERLTPYDELALGI